MHPGPDESALDEEADVVDTILRTAVNVWPIDPDAGVREGIWLAERFMTVGAEDELYDRYLAVCSSVYGLWGPPESTSVALPEADEARQRRMLT